MSIPQAQRRRSRLVLDEPVEVSPFSDAASEVITTRLGVGPASDVVGQFLVGGPYGVAIVERGVRTKSKWPIRTCSATTSIADPEDVAWRVKHKGRLDSFAGFSNERACD